MTVHGSLGSVSILAASVLVVLHPVRGVSTAEPRTNWTCVELYNDIPSRTALATTVFEGRARRVEPVPSWVKQQGDREHFNVTFKPRNLFKGNLPRTAEGGFETISVGVFGVAEDRSACVPSVQLASRYIVFLQGPGTPSEYNRELPFFRIFSFPQPFSSEAASLTAEYVCPNCTSQPTASLVPVEVKAKLNKRLVLQCLVTGRPFPVVTWFKDGQRLSNSAGARSRYTTIATKNGINLRINRFREEDSGSYSCHVINVLGEAHSNTTLVSVAPKPSVIPPFVLCTVQNYCLNGGVCYTIPALGKRFCECTRQFSGERCQDRYTDSLVYRLLADGHEQLRLETILIAAILAVVVILLITLLFLVCMVCRIRDKYSKVLLNSSRSKQSLRLDRMAALATANHLPSFCDSSIQTEPTHGNEMPNNGAAEPVYAVAAQKRYAMYIASEHERASCVPDGFSITGCYSDAMNCSRPVNASPALSAGCNQRLSEVFVSNGKISQGVGIAMKHTGCSNSVCNVASQTGCNRLSSGSAATSGCNAPLGSSNQDCSHGNCKASSVVTPAIMCCDTSSSVALATGSNRESCVSTTTAMECSPMPDGVGLVVECDVERRSNCSMTKSCAGEGCCTGECTPLSKSTGCQASKRFSSGCGDDCNPVKKTEDVTVRGCLPPADGISDHKLPVAVQDQDLICPVKSAPTESAAKQPQQTNTSNGLCPSSKISRRSTDCENSLHPEVTTICNGIGETIGQMSRIDPDRLPFEPDASHRRMVHTVPKHSPNFVSKNSILSDRCSSDCERNSPASDLEVNMESEVDIQALNVSEEELGKDLGQSRLFSHNNYESSVETTDSDSSLSSHEHEQLLLNRLKSHQPQLMDSSTEERSGRELGAGSAATELDWEKFSCPFNFNALDHTFTLNPYDIIYANKYLARNLSKTDTNAETQGTAKSEPPMIGVDQYPYDPDPDATVV